MVFEIGDKVVYPNHGIGVVEEIATRSTTEGAVRGYQLRILANDSRVFVPHDSASGVGLRAMVKLGDVRKVLNMLGDGQIEHQANWKGRFKDNSDRMRTGSLYDAAAVLKGLTFLAKKKALSFREKRMLERARFLVVSEIAEVEGKPSGSVEERVDRALSRTFAQETSAAGRAGARRGSVA